MFRTIAEKIKYPPWSGSAASPTRWRSLDQLDRLLDGKFYDHLTYGFYEEATRGGDVIKIDERRPSSQYHLPRMVARWSARKLWTGRHVPRVKHKEKDVTRVVGELIRKARFHDTMMNATMLGSVGSVAIVFRVSAPKAAEPQVAFRVWRAKECTPTFDGFNNLENLRVHYNVRGSELIKLGLTQTADPETKVSKDQEYWWVRDYGTDQERTYNPPRIEDWNPVQGWTRAGMSFSDAKAPVEHDLGFVPGVWVRNLAGTTAIDGIGTWEDSVSLSVEIDYLLSQASRGTRYNCAPELVIVGDVQHAGDEIDRGPASYIHLKGSVKQPDGDTFGEGSAELLEMTGEGIKAAHELVDKLRNMALEQIGATRKDPEKLKGVMSGRAMEFLDEDSHDLVMELRSSYGDGALELLRKVVRALGLDADPAGLQLDWPRLYQPTPEDLAHLIPALVLAATPIQEPLDPTEAAKIGGGEGGADSETSTKEGGESKHTAETRTNKSATGSSQTVKKEVKTSPVSAGNQGGRPTTQPSGGKILGALLEIEQASAFLKMNMDIDLLPDENEQGVSDSDVPVAGSQLPPRREPAAPEEADVGQINMDSPA